MARQPIVTDLEGLDYVSTPSATPVDAYSGKPALAADSSAHQLADALNVVSAAGQKSAEKAYLDRQEMEKQTAEKMAAEFTADADKAYLDATSLGQDFKYLSVPVVGNIIETKYDNESYNKTVKNLNNLPDNIRFDLVNFKNAYDNMVANEMEKTDGKFFVQGGTVTGMQRAWNEASKQAISEGKVFIEKEHKTAVNTKVFGFIKDADLKNPEEFAGVVEAIVAEDKLQAGDKKLNTAGTSPYAQDRVKDKRIWRDTLIQQAKNDPLRGNQILNIIEELPWSGDDETKEALVLARQEVTKLAVDEQQEKNAELQAGLAAASVDVDAKFANMASQQDWDGVKKILRTTMPEGLSDLEKGIFAMTRERAQQTLKNRYIDPIESSASYTLDKQDILLRGSLGKINLAEEIARARELPLTTTQMQAYLKELPVLIQGTSLLQTGTHTQMYDSRLRRTIDSMEDPLAANTKAISSLARQGTSLYQIGLEEFNRAVIRGITPILEKGEIPSPSDLDNEGGIYDRAADVVEAKLAKILSLSGAQQQAVSTPSEEVSQELELNGIKYTLKPGVTLENATEDDLIPVGDSTSEVTEPSANEPTVGNQQAPTDDYKVTNTDGQGEYLIDKSPEQTSERQQKAYSQATESLGFDAQSANFNLPEDMMAKVEEAVSARYANVGTSRGKGGKVKAPKENDIVELVIDSLGLSGNADFNYGPGFFKDDEPNTAGEIAVRRLVDSMMEKYKGE